MISTPLFENAWKNSKKNIFRLESLPEYNVDYDFDNFKKFKLGENYIGVLEQAWFNKLKTTKQRGVIMQRVRIISLPLSTYLKYEIDFWKHSMQNGEDFLFLKRGDFEKVKRAINLNPLDFWLFDGNVLILFDYDSSGDLLKEEKVNDAETIGNYKKLKQELIKKSTPMSVFMKELTT